MAQKIRIKDIAKMAGVSPGTVDRILHNRGNVSAEAREAVEKALSEVDYRPNIHISALSLKKTYRIIITMPIFAEGEYWSIVHKGIMKAVDEYSNIDLDIEFFFYDQFDLYSCRNTFQKVMTREPEAVIIGPTFQEETKLLAHWLEEKKIPYFYVDSTIDDTSPQAFFSSDHYKCGYLTSKLITKICPAESDYVLFQAVRVGDASANVTILRKSGFNAYFAEYSPKSKVHKVTFSVNEPGKNDQLIGDFFEQNPTVKGAIVLSSRGNVIADYLRRHNVNDIKLICIDLTSTNYRALEASEIDFVVGQRPATQGFLAVKALIRSLIYGDAGRVENFLPLDILTKENLDFYNEFSSMSDEKEM